MPWRSSQRRSSQLAPVLTGRRILLRPLEATDFRSWQRARRLNVEWLTKWEPKRHPKQPDAVEDQEAFASRCAARARERQLGAGFGFGIFLDGTFIGEMNINSIQRGAFQNCYVGYWIDQRVAGKGYTPEALVLALKFAFEDLQIHRVQIAIIPRNEASLRVVQKLEIRPEGVAERYLEINGQWEDHLRHAITSEEWLERAESLGNDWL